MPEAKYQRPSWDKYFVDVSRAVATRATCDRGRSGCVIARDKQILVTCAKMIANSWIVRIVCEKRYHADSESEDIFRHIGLDLDFLDEGVVQYEKQ